MKKINLSILSLASLSSFITLCMDKGQGVTKINPLLLCLLTITYNAQLISAELPKKRQRIVHKTEESQQYSALVKLMQDQGIREHLLQYLSLKDVATLHRCCRSLLSTWDHGKKISINTSIFLPQLVKTVQRVHATNPITLKLSGKDTTDASSECIQLLPCLKKLDLNETNCIHTFLPPLCTKLPNLRTLVLRCNSLNRLPQEIKKLTQLRSLDLSDNDFVDSRELSEIGTCAVGLHTLLLHNNEELDRVPHEISSLTQLRKLDVSRCSLDDEAFCALCSQCCTQLVELNVENNFIEDVPVTLNRLIQLETLHLSQNELIPDALSRLCSLCPQLKKLFLNSMRSTIKDIPKEIQQFTQLKKLELADNHLSPQVIIQLCTWHPPRLCTLDLSFNDLDSLPGNIQQLTQLKKLKLYGNHFAPVAMAQVYRWCAHLEAVEFFFHRKTAIPKQDM